MNRILTNLRANGEKVHEEFAPEMGMISPSHHNNLVSRRGTTVLVRFIL